MALAGMRSNSAVQTAVAGINRAGRIGIGIGIGLGGADDRLACHNQWQEQKRPLNVKAADVENGQLPRYTV